MAIILAVYLNNEMSIELLVSAINKFLFMILDHESPVTQ